MKKVAMYIGVGALLGYVAGYVLDQSRDVVVTESK
jgi:uncharacterized membrane protein (Fun14 family)